ncbi:DASS family sodium-coupled anion symporter [Cytobacillus depressus]|uniref:DASS family sodium-coupled anion symporter n=1 Tax=Cytobacillus depressus TaxID=1602942 RepID=A0A6L3V4E4_9BACI|nr:DASS family sodium-coupled anion symporter [Cytobacillus depressus]KAB2332277.1 DASS family sodium-coupled anion symporter [Cytobacillus depressus]
MEKKRVISILLAFVAFLIIILLPNPDSLPIAGQRALAILALAVILWVTEAVSFPVSAAIIVGLITISIGLAPTIDNPSTLYTSQGALKLALGGFSSSAVGLVGGALFIAAAMEITGLHKRVALFIMSKVGTKTNSLIIGTILVSIVLALFVPSATARAGTTVPILMGMIAAFGLQKNSRFAALLMITAVQAISIWNIGIKTSAAQNMVALGFMEKAFGSNITWGNWFIYAAPWSLLMSIVLFFVMIRLIKPEVSELPGGKEVIVSKLAELGKLTSKELKLIIISVLLLFFWSTEGILHPFDSTTVTLIAVAIMLLPGIGIYTWKEVESKIPWGTLVVFAIGISLGTVLLDTQGAQWLSSVTLEALGLTSMPLVYVIMILSLFNILIHLGFASATSLSSAFIPIVIALVTAMGPTSFNGPGLVLIQQFVISFGFLLPVSAPQNMLAYGTGTFTSKDLLKSGLPITIIGYILIIIFSLTYWKWVGLL